MSIRVAVIGAGVMGRDHARIFAEDLSGAILQVVCDADADRARQVAEAFGAVDVATDPRAVIVRSDVDAILIASPDHTHAPLAQECIAAGKPLLCEKPLSQSSQQCLRVLDAEIRSGRRLVQVGFMRRFDQSYAEMKAALRDGSIGRAMLMHNFHRNVETPAADFTADMAITNSAPHEFDVARFVLETEYASVCAFQPKRSGSLVAPVLLVLDTRDGQVVTIEINNNAAYGYDVRGELVGETGAVSIGAPSYSRRDISLSQRTAYAPDWRPRYAEAYRRQNKAFLQFVRTGAFPEIASDCWDGYCAAVAAESGVRALGEGRKVPVEMVEMPAFYTRTARAAK